MNDRRWLHVVVLTFVAMVVSIPTFYRINFPYSYLTLSTPKTNDYLLSGKFYETMEKCKSDPIFEYQIIETKDWLTPLVSASLDAPEDVFIRTTYVMIGDSLDRILVFNLCELLGGSIEMVDKQNKNQKSRTMVCRAPQEGVQIAYLNIFGMARPCKDTKNWSREDDRDFETTAERIKVVLPEVLDILETNQTHGGSSPPPPVVVQGKWINCGCNYLCNILFSPLVSICKMPLVQVGSNLWDLSEGCNDEVDITPDYAREYQMGMKDTYLATQGVLESYFPNRDSFFFWKLAPPVSQDKSDWSEETFRGRNRFNQMELNRLIVDTWNEQPELGTGFLDLWNLVELAIPSEEYLNEVELKEDGRHYSKCPSLAFFNVLLEATQEARRMRYLGDVSR